MARPFEWTSRSGSMGLFSIPDALTGKQKEVLNTFRRKLLRCARTCATQTRRNERRLVMIYLTPSLWWMTLAARTVHRAAHDHYGARLCVCRSAGGSSNSRGRLVLWIMDDQRRRRRRRRRRLHAPKRNNDTVQLSIRGTRWCDLERVASDTVTYWACLLCVERSKPRSQLGRVVGNVV